MPLVSFHTLKIQTKNIFMFSGGIGRDQWHENGLIGCGNQVFSFILGVKMSAKADNEGYLVVQHSAHFLKTSWKTKYVMVSG